MQCCTVNRIKNKIKYKFTTTLVDFLWSYFVVSQRFLFEQRVMKCKNRDSR